MSGRTLRIDKHDTSAHSQPLHSDLSPREVHGVCRLGTGAGVFEIANELGLGIKTVSTYRTRPLDKRYLHTNADITVYTIRHGLIANHASTDRMCAT
jgi:DNA-binding NarL/FixJ family response regulator